MTETHVIVNFGLSTQSVGSLSVSPMCSNNTSCLLTIQHTAVTTSRTSSDQYIVLVLLIHGGRSPLVSTAAHTIAAHSSLSFAALKVPVLQDSNCRTISQQNYDNSDLQWRRNEFESGGRALIRRKAPDIFLAVPLHIFGSKSTVSRLGERIRDG